jgi:putative Mg2+ transporter-C (MgtC) family protein
MLPTEEILLRLFLAAVLGSLIGVERERRTWTAGLRTHMLVCVGSCLFMIVSAYGFNDVISAYRIVLDPSRVAAQVVSGIGFLGAGIIIFRREVVRGLTTAASIWTVSAIGLATGGGLYVAAASTTALILLILAGLKPLEQRITMLRRPHRLEIVADKQSVSMESIVDALTTLHVAMHDVDIETSEGGAQEHITVTIRPKSALELAAVIDQLRTLPGVTAIRDVS